MTSNTDPKAKPSAGEKAPSDPSAARPETPLQTDEKRDEGPLESLGNAISAPVRDAAEADEREQTGKP